MTTTHDRATGSILERATKLDALLLDPVDATQATRPTQRRDNELIRSIEDGILDLTAVLPEGTEDYLARRLFELTIQLRRRVEELAGAPDVGRTVSLVLAQMRDVLALLERRQEHVALDDPNEAARATLAWLDGVPSKGVATILGVSEKTVTSWRTSTVKVTRNTERVVLVAQLLSYIKGSWTPRGRADWFSATHPRLGGRSPLELIEQDVPTAREPLRTLARSTRGQLGD